MFFPLDHPAVESCRRFKFLGFFYFREAGQKKRGITRVRESRHAVSYYNCSPHVTVFGQDTTVAEYQLAFLIKCQCYCCCLWPIRCGVFRCTVLVPSSKPPQGGSSPGAIFWGAMVKGGYTPLLFWSNGGIGQARPREAPARDPDCPEFRSDALARCPQALSSTYTFLFFFEDVVGANGTAAHEGS